MHFLASLPAAVAELGARDWMNFVVFLTTPLIFAWYVPTRNAFVAILASSMLLVVGICVWTGQSVDFIFGFTLVVGAVVASLCSAAMLLRRFVTRVSASRKSV